LLKQCLVPLWLMATLSGLPLVPFHAENSCRYEKGVTSEGALIAESSSRAVRCENGRLALTVEGDVVFRLSGRRGIAAEEWPIMAERYLGAHNERAPLAATNGIVEIGKIYDGIEMSLEPRAAGLVRMLSVAPKADPGQIAVELESDLPLRMSRCGVVEAVPEGHPALTVIRPIAYQDIPAGRRLIDVALIRERDRYRLKLGNYDRSDTLTVELRTF
jgi:hypothetical protein